MIRFRPLHTLLAWQFFFHLMVAGSGLAMEMGDGGAMRGMEMSAAAMVDSAERVESGTPSPDSEDAPCSGEVPCQIPGTPNGCPATLPCHSATSLPSEHDIARAEFTLQVRVMALAILAPHTRLSPPELPPPRA